MLADPAFAPWREEAVRRGYASSIVLPLSADSRAFGAVTIYSREPEAFTQDEAALLNELAGDLAYGIGAIRLRSAHMSAEAQLRRAHDELEERVRERTDELEKRTAQLRALALELTQTESRERKRLAIILHDHLQQLLVGAKLGAQYARQQVANDEAAASIDNVLGLLDESIKTSRSLTAELSPPILHEVGLVAALQWLARWMQEKHGLSVDVTARVETPPDPEGVCVILFQCVRELLFNVSKHAGVARAEVCVAPLGGDLLEITVSDRGVGFDAVEATERGSEGGLGLFSIRERVDLLGGSLAIDSAAGRGTRVVIAVAVPGVAVLAEAAVSAPSAVPHAQAVRRTGDCIRVLVADDHRIMREGLVRLLQAEADIEVVGEAADGADGGRYGARAQARRHHHGPQHAAHDGDRGHRAHHPRARRRPRHRTLHVRTGRRRRGHAQGGRSRVPDKRRPVSGPHRRGEGRRMMRTQPGYSRS